MSASQNTELSFIQGLPDLGQLVTLLNSATEMGESGIILL